jgi:hypothetical protein
VLVELLLLLEESIGVGWRRRPLLMDAVALVGLVLLFGGKASALVGEGDCCGCMQWRSSSWCFSSRGGSIGCG